MDMASSDLTNFYSETCKRIEALESEKRTMMVRRNERASAEYRQDHPAAAATIRGQCVSERFQSLETLHCEFRLIEQQLNQRLASGADDAKVIESEILRWKKRFLTRAFIWQAAITQDHWYFTRSLIHLFIGQTCGRHPLCGVEGHLKPLVDPSEQDPSKWDAALQLLRSREPMPGLLFIALQTTKPPSNMTPPQSRECPVSAYGGKFANRISQLLGSGEQIRTEAGMVPGGIPTFIHLLGADAAGEFIRFLVVCNMENGYVLVDFSQSQASRGALLQMFQSPSIEKLVWNKDAVSKALQCTLWADPESFNEVYDLSAPWAIGTGTAPDDVRYVNEVCAYLKTLRPSSVTPLRNSELALVADVLFHIKELGEIFGSSIIDVVPNDKADWVISDAVVGWKRIDPKIFVSLVVTATALSDVATATAILNPHWRMGLGTCPSILAMAVERFLTTVSVPAQCVAKVVEKAEFPLPTCQYNAECGHDFVQKDAASAPGGRKVDEDEFTNLQKEIDGVYKQKADLERLGPWLKRNSVATDPATPLAPSRSAGLRPLLENLTAERPPASAAMERYRDVSKPKPVPTSGFGVDVGRRSDVSPMFSPAQRTSNLARNPPSPVYSQRHAFPPRSLHLPTLAASASFPPKLPQVVPDPTVTFLTKKEIDKEVAKLQSEEIPPWVRSHMMLRVPLFAERNEEWAKIPVPRLTMPAYYKTLGQDDPLMYILIQWRQEYKQATIRWSKREPWRRMTIFLGALATDAQLLACRIVHQLAKPIRRHRPGRPYTKYSKPSLAGLLTEFCAYVEEITYARPADENERRKENARNAQLRRLMEAALANQKQEAAAVGNNSASTAHAVQDTRTAASIKRNDCDESPKKTRVGTAFDKNAGVGKSAQKPFIPKNMRLFYSMEDTYPLAIVPSTTFEKLKNGFYTKASTDPNVSYSVGADPHPLCEMLPAQIVPPKLVLRFVLKSGLRVLFQAYNPFEQSNKDERQLDGEDEDGQRFDGESGAKKARLDEGAGDGVLALHH